MSSQPTRSSMNWYDGVTPDDLPGDLGLVAQECGVETAIRMAEALGGMKIYILKPESVLMPLKKAFIRTHREVPIRDLVLLTRLSETTVRDILREADDDRRQGGLF